MTNNSPCELPAKIPPTNACANFTLHLDRAAVLAHKRAPDDGPKELCTDWVPKSPAGSLGSFGGGGLVPHSKTMSHERRQRRRRKRVQKSAFGRPGLAASGSLRRVRRVMQPFMQCTQSWWNCTEKESRLKHPSHSPCTLDQVCIGKGHLVPHRLVSQKT